MDHVILKKERTRIYFNRLLQPSEEVCDKASSANFIRPS